MSGKLLLLLVLLTSSAGCPGTQSADTGASNESAPTPTVAPAAPTPVPTPVPTPAPETTQAAEPAAEPTAEPAASERTHGACGKFEPAAPAPGCRWDGPWPGTFEGATLSAREGGAAIPAKGLPVDDAATACYGLRQRCAGISTPWYTGSPYRLYDASQPFRYDSGSYACTFVLVCE